MNYALYLKQNGEGFQCRMMGYEIPDEVPKYQALREKSSIVTDFLVKEGEFFYMEYSFFIDGKWSSEKIQYNITSNEVPDCIKQALACENRQEVELYINNFLINSKVSPRENKHLVENADGTQTELSLRHYDFKEKEPGLNGHFQLKHSAHSENPQEMLQFVNNRSAFFVKNYRAGQKYQNTSWINPSWVFTCLNYYSEACKNSLASIWLLGMAPTQFCNDFDAGRRSAVDLENTEATASFGM